MLADEQAGIVGHITVENRAREVDRLVRRTNGNRRVHVVLPRRNYDLPGLRNSSGIRWSKPRSDGRFRNPA